MSFLRGVGLRYVQAGRPEDAKRIFETLIVVDGERPEYREALAAAGVAGYKAEP